MFTDGKNGRRWASLACVLLCALFCMSASALAQSSSQKQTWSAAEAPVVERMRHLRDTPDEQRPAVTREIAAQIRALPPTANKEKLAASLANLVTEGDPGHETIQDAATTLADALREQPIASEHGEIADPYMTLASLARYEHVSVKCDDPQFAAAMKKLEDADHARETADFTLTDLHGKQWNLRQLRGKVVLVNFWATWCPPCRKELPDLEALYEKFRDKGFIVLAISDEESAKVEPFVAQRKLSFPVLLDPGRKANDAFQVFGIPKSFVYDRQGKLVSEAIDMRTRDQFLTMLRAAGLE